MSDKSQNDNDTSEEEIIECQLLAAESDSEDARREALQFSSSELTSLLEVALQMEAEEEAVNYTLH